MSEAIQLEHVVRMYPPARRIISDITLCIHRGESICISGAPKSGKTTLMKLIAGMEHPSAGSIYVMEEAMHEMDADSAADFRNRNMAVMLQAPYFVPGLTIWENIGLPLLVRGVEPGQRIKMVKQQLKILEISNVACAYPRQIPLFEGQIASLARALIVQPKILLLDEIDANLSERETKQIAKILDGIRQNNETTMVYFTGRQRTELNTDRQFILDYGKIREE